MTSAVSWMNGGGGFYPISGLGNLSDGVYTDFRDGSLTGAKGGTWALTRATATTTIDSSDLVQNVSSGAPRWYRTGASSGLTGLWGPFPAHTNLCLQSEDFATTWAATGSPTRSAGAATCGVVSLDLIGDDSALAIELYSQTITFTADAVKSVSIFVKKGSATSSAVRLFDTTALADRLLGFITWTGSVPTVTMATGTLEGTDALAGGVYRIRMTTTSVTAANTNSLRIYPATDDVTLDVASQGDIYAGGVMAENALFCSPYIKTTTAAVTVNADVVTLAGTGIINDTEGTLYVQAAAGYEASAVKSFFEIDDGTANERVVLARNTATKAQLLITDGGVSQAALNSAANWTAGASAKLAGRYRLNDSNQALNGVAATADTACTMPTSTTFRLGSTNTAIHGAGIIQVVAYSRTGASDANLAIASTP